MVMNKLIEPGLIKLYSLLEGLFLPSIVVIVFNKNGPIRIHYLRVYLWVLLGLRDKDFVVLNLIF